MSRNSDLGIALLIGVAVGAGLGILLAPDKGSKTREKIKDGFDDAKKKVKDKYDSVSSDIKERISNVNPEEAYNDIVSNLSQKSEDVIKFMEEKLAKLKTEAAKYQ